MTTTPATPCSVPECNTDGTGEPCDRHETEQAHAAGEHEFCGVICEVKFPSDQMRNFVVAKGYPGTAGMLAELERRAAAPAARVQAECDRIEAAVRANPTNPDFDGAYLASIKHIRRALSGEDDQ